MAHPSQPGEAGAAAKRDEGGAVAAAPYHRARPLLSVAVPPLDRDSATALPPALKQLADFNPRGEDEGKALPPRRRRKAVPLGADFVKEPPAVAKGATLLASPASSPRKAAKPSPTPKRAAETGKEAGKPLSPPPPPVRRKPRPSPTKRPAATPPRPKEEPLLAPEEVEAYQRVAREAEERPPVDPATLPQPLRQLLDHNPRGYAEVLPPRRHKEPPQREGEPEPRRQRPLDTVEPPPLDKFADTASLPKELRQLRDHNVRGAVELQPALGPRRRKAAGPLLAGGPKQPSPRKRPSSDSGKGKGKAALSAPEAEEAPKEDPFAQLVSQTPREELPAALRALLDHNPKGATEELPLSRRRKPKPVEMLDLGDSWTRRDRSGKRARSGGGGGAAAAAAPPPPLQPAAAAVAQPPECRWVVPEAPSDRPEAKVWVLMGPAAHRRFRSVMGAAYKYKQLLPTPAYLRRHGYPFVARVHNEGELIVTLGDSHYVVSGSSRGFSWSHVDPSTLARLEDSDAHHGSRQCDGKPNTFSAHFHRSPTIMEALRHNLATAQCWNQPAEEAAARVAATATDAAYKAARLAEGWREEELRPLFAPTPEQFGDPLWFTAMMAGPGREAGSLHIRLPRAWCADESHGRGHVPWSPAAPLWRLEVLPPPPEVEREEQRVMGVRVFRPEGSGVKLDGPLAQGQRRIVVPTAPGELTAFIDALEHVAEASPVLYGPQSRLSPEQVCALGRVMPAWAMPLSEADGLRNVLDAPSEGTTTPTGFGGSFGVTGLHDEYNHTCSLFAYPLWSPHP